MAKNNLGTVFQQLDKAITGDWGDVASQKHINSYNLSQGTDNVLYKTHDKQDFEKHKLELQQNSWLNDRWVRANVDLSVQAFAGLNNVKLMYRDADLMDSFPEIGAALDIVSEESTVLSEKGQVVNVSSKSDRIRAILEDLFVNRLDLQVTAQMIIRAMCKYGNQFMMLNLDHKNGVMGWRQLPVFNVERLENGIENPYGGQGYRLAQNVDKNSDLSTKFIWTDETSEQIPFRNWQIAHFRLINNSLYLPYGISYLNSARRHWRMLSLMEDMMLIYRLERSIERRVYKIYVGAIDDADVQGYVQDIANNFKRTPIIDPMTGQVDLRKNIMPVHKDTPIPLLDGRTITIENLAKEFEEGKTNYVYSVQDKTHKIVPGKVVWCGKNYTADKLVKITLDDDTYCIMAPEHELIMRDGSKKRADEVTVGESVMPFYRDTNLISKHFKNDYETIYNPNSGKYEFTHRLIGNELSSNIGDNVIHHKDFNRFNNSPINLQWMTWEEHRNYHTSLNSTDRVREMRKESSKNRWFNEEFVSKAKKNMTVRFDCHIWDEIDKAVINGVIYSQKTMIDFINQNLIDYLLSINTSKKLHNFKKVTKPLVKARIYEHGYDNINHYLSYMEQKYNLNKHENILNAEKSQRCKLNNMIKNIGVRWENTNRKDEIIQKIKNSLSSYVKKTYLLDLSDKLWEDIRLNVIQHNINTQLDLIGFVKNHLSLNDETKTSKVNVDRHFIYRLLKRKGFTSTKDYIESVRKNHKIKSIDLVGGDDVYCMTVVGLCGEEDRHNFALSTWKSDGSVCKNGIFVSNCCDQDIFIPVRDANAPTPIETLSAAQNLTALDDIKFVQNKVLTALRIPKTFLNFEEAAGNGQNLALQDVRFTRTVNRIQQAFLMELTKVASIHLYLLGFEDDLTNFSLSMTNPSTQAEQLEIDNITKKVGAVQTAVADPGNGIPIMSLTRALKEIMKWSEKDIQDNFEEMRLEKAIANELQMTNQIIKRTGVFDVVDRIYGEPGAQYQENQQQGEGDDGMGGGGGAPPMGGGGDFGGGLDDLGAPGADDSGDIGGAEGEAPIGDVAGGDLNGGAAPQPMEAVSKNKPLLVEQKNKTITDLPNGKIVVERPKILDDSFLINEEFDGMIKSLDKFIND